MIWISAISLCSIVFIFSVSLFLYTEHSTNGYIFLLTTILMTPTLITPIVTISGYNTTLLVLETTFLLETDCLVRVGKVILKQEILIGSVFSILFSVIRVMLLN
jgi:hypothetical protein